MLWVVVEPSLVVELWPLQLLSFSPGSSVPLVSQPSSAPGAAGRVQSAYGALQLGAHTPAPQLRVATLAAAHGREQPPQWSTSLPVCVVQPAGFGPHAA